MLTVSFEQVDESTQGNAGRKQGLHKSCRQDKRSAAVEYGDATLCRDDAKRHRFPVKPQQKYKCFSGNDNAHKACFQFA
jgi:hypothetical protein